MHLCSLLFKLKIQLLRGVFKYKFVFYSNSTTAACTLLYLIITALPKIISPLKDLEKCSLILLLTLNLVEATNSQKKLILASESQQSDHG